MEIIREKDGRIRDCIHNRISLGFWGSCIEFHSYKRCYKFLASWWEEFIEAAVMVPTYILMVIAFPILPLIQCALKYISAKKQWNKQ